MSLGANDWPVDVEKTSIDVEKTSIDVEKTSIDMDTASINMAKTSINTNNAPDDMDQTSVDWSDMHLDLSTVDLGEKRAFLWNLRRIVAMKEMLSNRAEELFNIKECRGFLANAPVHYFREVEFILAEILSLLGVRPYNMEPEVSINVIHDLQSEDNPLHSLFGMNTLYVFLKKLSKYDMIVETPPSERVGMWNGNTSVLMNLEEMESGTLMFGLAVNDVLELMRNRLKHRSSGYTELKFLKSLMCDDIEISGRILYRHYLNHSRSSVQERERIIAAFPAPPVPTASRNLQNQRDENIVQGEATLTEEGNTSAMGLDDPSNGLKRSLSRKDWAKRQSKRLSHMIFPRFSPAKAASKNEDVEQEKKTSLDEDTEHEANIAAMGLDGPSNGIKRSRSGKDWVKRQSRRLSQMVIPGFSPVEAPSKNALGKQKE